MDETLRTRFFRDVAALDYGRKARVLTVAVKLPSGAIEVIINREQLENKIDYYTLNYDHKFKLISNPEVQIVGYMLV